MTRHVAGRRAEEAVADLLVARGFRVLGMNVRLGHLELDVVAKKGAMVVVVEVRTRGDGAYAKALASISPAKRRHLVLATERLWRRSLVHDPQVERVRIDVAAVYFEATGTSVEYIAGAVVSGA